jgi:hypothetical protein
MLVILVSVFAAIFVLVLFGIVGFLARRLFGTSRRTLLQPLSPPSGIDRNSPLPISDRVLEIAIDPDRKIEACKAYIDETGVSLREAKAIIEFYSDEYHRR